MHKIDATPTRAEADVIHLGGLYAPIADALAGANERFADELTCDQGFVQDILHHVDQFHGKRLRPALLLLSAQAASGETRDEHLTLAAVVEMVHIATLVHDDILDDADIRRRAATVNRLWGNHRAVLTGDILFSHAYRLCATLPDQHAAQLIGQVGVTLSEGEMMQNYHAGNWELSEAEYFDIIDRKTASLIAACTYLGPRYGGCDAATCDQLREYGRAAGLAFQIADDLLDLTGDEAQVGKSLGRDVHLGKPTLPLIHYLAHCSSAARAEMLTVLRGTDDQRYRTVARMLQSSDSVDYARGVAEKYVEHALAALAGLTDTPARRSLEVMARFITARRH